MVEPSFVMVTGWLRALGLRLERSCMEKPGGDVATTPWPLVSYFPELPGPCVPLGLPGGLPPGSFPGGFLSPGPLLPGPPPIFFEAACATSIVTRLIATKPVAKVTAMTAANRRVLIITYLTNTAGLP